jgi:hypothetical protein
MSVGAAVDTSPASGGRAQRTLEQPDSGSEGEEGNSDPMNRLRLAPIPPHHDHEPY